MGQAPKTLDRTRPIMQQHLLITQSLPGYPCLHQQGGLLSQTIESSSRATDDIIELFSQAV